jgi:RND family efflux transporter MFP subunit
MKKATFLLLLTAIISSCGGDGKSLDSVLENGSLEEIRSKREEFVAKQLELNEQLARIDATISKMDTVKKLPLVTAFTAKKQVFNHFLEIQGDVETKKNIVLYPEYNGVLTRIYVKEGDKVSKGQLLASIDDGGLSQQLAQMEVQSSLAKTTFERQERLWNQKIGSEIQYLQAKASYEAQQNAVNQMKAQLGKTSIRAPFSGIVDDVMTEQGTVVSAGQSPVIRLVDLADMYIQADIPESFLNSVTKGKDVSVYFPVLGDTIAAKIRQVGNYIEPSNRTFKIEVAVPNTNKMIKPNLTAKLNINDYTNSEAILIPQSVLSENADGEQYVYVTSGNNSMNEAIASRRIVKTGKTQGDYVEILSGIMNGDTVVQEGARSVKDGQTVKILNVSGDE